MLQNGFSNKVVVITGASSGIGRATALEFARRGATIVLAARREDALDSLAEECQGIGGNALAIPTDVTDAEAVHNLARKTYETFGHLDVWVNNAAVTIFGHLEEMPPEPVKQVVDTNILGMLYGAQAALPYFRERGRGTLVNVSSVVGIAGQPYTVPYSVTKSAIVGLSKSLDQELADEKDIHVCLVLPASIDTPIFGQAANYSGRQIVPLKPILDPQRVADAIVSLTEHPRREVYVGRAGHMMSITNALFPGMAHRMTRKMIEQEHFEDKPAPHTEGNLFRPMRGRAQVSGGWKPREALRPAMRGALVAAGMLGAGLVTTATLLRRRPQKRSWMRPWA
jgi:short-subunit dehydrogenase